MHRPPYHYSYHRARRPLLARGPLGPLLLLLAVMALAGGVALASLVIAVLATLGALALAGVATGAIVSRWRRTQRMMTWQRRPAPSAVSPTVSVAPATSAALSVPSAPAVPAVPVVPVVPDWAVTRARFAQLRSEYGQFECDPLAVLRLPALTDVTVPSTGRFVDAFAEAQALDTETSPPPQHAARFARAVDAAWRAWHAARDAAQRIRLAGIPAEERATVQRAIKLLTMARDSDHDAERAAAYSRARAELAKLDRRGTLRLPPAAAAALDAAARGQLPPVRS